MDDCIHNNPQKLCPNVANFWGLWSNVSNYIVELILVALAIYGGESFVLYEYFTIFVVLLGRVIPRAKGKFIFTKNLDNFLHQMDNSSLICFDAILGVAHIGRNVYWCGPRPEAL